MFRRKQKHSMESDHHHSSRTECRSLVERLSQRCQLSRIDEVLKCCTSLIKLHTLSHIPSSCLYIQLPVNATAPRILTHVSPSHVKILFYTDKIDACDLRAPRRHTGTIFEVHPGATTFPPVLSISATASALHGPIRFSQTPFQCPRSRTATLALRSRSTPALTQA